MNGVTVRLTLTVWYTFTFFFFSFPFFALTMVLFSFFFFLPSSSLCGVVWCGGAQDVGRWVDGLLACFD